MSGTYTTLSQPVANQPGASRFLDTPTGANACDQLGLSSHSLSDLPLKVMTVPPRPALHVIQALVDPPCRELRPAFAGKFQEKPGLNQASATPGAAQASPVWAWLLFLVVLLFTGSVGPLLTVYSHALRTRAFFIGGWHLMLAAILFTLAMLIMLRWHGLSEDHKKMVRSPMRWPVFCLAGMFYGCGFGVNALAIDFSPNFAMVNILFGVQPCFVLCMDVLSRKYGERINSREVAGAVLCTIALALVVVKHGSESPLGVLFSLLFALCSALGWRCGADAQ
eukprot:NODE_439_length_2251_cov_20.144868_g405_i0.p1 GENE.NODE_439_length_2251_cov_20.144868_g405_i0~~NODE_439_length_2251_cov_20.144868_g405_i0.p1  ORF type:complete len:296 (-),score=39.00 NODE_439_length_2251_cov_20.144868_g405_i0:1362-2201(-)